MTLTLGYPLVTLCTQEYVWSYYDWSDHCDYYMSSHCSFVIVFDVKHVTLESINDSVFSLTYILYVAPFALKTIYKIVTLECTFCDYVVGCIIVEICYFP